ncbi:biopolymer transporter ExbD [Sphaerochaeta sp.]|uniref:biopolymer transporter ExbD n=1 Tax=Sphaerochaeta sp. TaxID=1972642 RepID=UPI002FCB8253
MRKQRPTPPSALSDIAFLLLLFFLIMAITSVQTPVPLDPAQAQAKSFDTSDLPVLLVAKDGSLYLDGNPVRLEELPNNRRYALLSDASTPYATIHPIIEALRKQGVQTLSCIVEVT